MEKLDPLEYTALPAHQIPIRLLELIPDAKGTIRCHIKTVSLHDKESFNALSYTWGDPVWRGNFNDPNPQYDEPTYEIECDGRALSIRQSLWEVLHQICEK